MPPKRRTEPHIRAAIEHLAVAGHSGVYIERQLRANKKLHRDDIPSLRTIQAIAREAAPPDPAAWWSPVDADPDEARAILPVLGELLRHTDGRGRITRDHASWVAAVLRWAPGLPPAEAYTIGWAYAVAARASSSTESLDRYLALEHWRDATLHVRAFRQGWLDVLVWQPEMERFGDPRDFEFARRGATILWPFMDPLTPIAALKMPRRGTHQYAGIRLPRDPTKQGGSK